MHWHTKISHDLTAVADFITFFENELVGAKAEVKIFGNVEKNIAALPGVTEHRFNQLQAVEAVLSYLNIQLRKIRRVHFQKYMEAYNRVLTSRDAEKYVDGEDEVIDYEILINDVAFVRNQYLGILKGLDSKSFSVGHITRLKVAGMEDFNIG